MCLSRSVCFSACTECVCFLCLVSLLLPDFGYHPSSRLALTLDTPSRPASPPSGSPMSPELPETCVPAFLGLEIRLSKYLAASRGFRVSREEDGFGWRRVSPAPGGPQSHDVLSFASAGPLAARPLSGLAMEGRRGCCWLWPGLEPRRPGYNLCWRPPEIRGSRAEWEAKLRWPLSTSWVSRKCTLSQESLPSGPSWTSQILLSTSGC